MAFLAVSEPSWTHLGAILLPLGRVLGRLVAVLGRLGTVLGRLGAVLASQKPPSEKPKNIDFPWFFQGFRVPRPPWNDLGSTWPSWPSWSRLGIILDASWGHLGAILGRLGRVLGRLVAVLGRLVANLASQNPPKNDPKSIPKLIKNRSKIDAILGPQKNQKYTLFQGKTTFL